MQVVLAMDSVLASNRRIGLHVDRDKADRASLMTLASPSGHSLRPDGVMRTVDGLRLLAKVCADCVPAMPLSLFSFCLNLKHA